MILRTLFILALAFQWVRAGELHAPLQSDQWVVRAYFSDLQMVQELSRERAVWNVDRRRGFVILDVGADGMALLEELGFVWDVDEEATNALRTPHQALDGQTLGIPGFPCYLTVEETFTAAEDLVSAAPQLSQWVDIGDSWEKTQDPNQGYDLMVLKLTNRDIPGPKPVLFVMSAIHAREYTTSPMNLRFAQHLVNGYGQDADATWLLDDHEIHLLLQANPDGRKRAESGLFWRKNANDNFCTGTNSRGVDLNRNFEIAWGCCGSSGNPCSDAFRGTEAGSEPEVAAVQDYIRTIFPDQKEGVNDPAPPDATGVFIDMHSFGEVVIWSYGFTPDLAPNSQGLTTLGRKMGWYNGYFPEPISQFTSAGGSTADYAYAELGVAAYGYELGTTFFQSCNVFEDQVVPDNLPALIYAATVSRTPYLTASGPETLDVQLIDEPNGDLILTATLNDTRFNNQNGAEPFQNITHGEFYIDVPPWGENPVAHPLQAADGAFNSPVEAVTGLVDLIGPGRSEQMIYVRGRDASGQWGPVTAVFHQGPRFNDLMAQWPVGVTVLDLLDAL